jgi:hypothetical protein
MEAQLNNVLASAHKSAPDCQFALTYIRKYLELNKCKGFDNLSMFINWTLHSQLDNAYVQRLLKEIDDFLNEYLKVDNNISLSNVPTLEYKLSFFKALYTELTDFLNLVGADTSLVTDTNKFNCFIKNFESIVANTPLIVKPDRPLIHLTKVCLSKRELPFPFADIEQDFYWTIYKDNDVMLRVKLQRKKLGIYPFEFMIDMCILIKNKDLN